MKNEKIIKKICIEIGGVEVEVTPEQARQLHDALGSLLGLDKPAPVVYSPPVIIRERPWYPTWTYSGTQPIWPNGTSGGSVSYSATNSTARLKLQ